MANRRPPAPPQPPAAPPGPSATPRHLRAAPLRHHRPAATSSTPSPHTESTRGPEVLERLRQQDRDLRQWHLRVRTWAIAEGVAIDRDGLTVVLAMALETQRNGGPDPTFWTAERVDEVAWSGSAGWAARLQTRLPEETGSALTWFWAYLATHHGFASGSAALEDLVEALAAHTDPAQRTTDPAQRTTSPAQRGGGRKHPSARKQNVRG